MNSRTFLFAAATLLALVHPAFAQTDPHHPSGSADTASSEQPAPTVTPPPEMPAVPAADDSAVTCPPMMSMMADMMKMMQQGAGDTPEMQMMQMMQATQMGMMQQMQEMQNDLMKNAPADKAP